MKSAKESSQKTFVKISTKIDSLAVEKFVNGDIVRKPQVTTWTDRTRSAKDARACEGLEEKSVNIFRFRGA